MPIVYKSRLITEMKPDEYSTARPDTGATEVKQFNPGGPEDVKQLDPGGTDQRQSIKIERFTPEPSSEARPVGVQLKRAAKLLTVIRLTSKHAVCLITFKLYSIIL